MALGMCMPRLCLSFFGGGQSSSLLCFAEVSPLPAVLRQTEQAQPSREREEKKKKKREETHRKKDQLAQQLSRALRRCLPLPLRCTETHRCLPAASLPFTHEHGPVLLSHTGSLAGWSALIMEQCHQAGGQHSCLLACPLLFLHLYAASPTPTSTHKPAPLNMIYRFIIKGQKHSKRRHIIEIAREKKKEAVGEWILANS